MKNTNEINENRKNLENFLDKDLLELSEKIKLEYKKIEKLDADINEYKTSKKMKKIFSILFLGGGLLGGIAGMIFSTNLAALVSIILGVLTFGFIESVFGTNKTIENTIKYLESQKEISNCIINSDKVKLSKLMKMKELNNGVETEELLQMILPVKHIEEKSTIKVKTREKIVVR